jgi:hypothetical protein
MLTLSTVGLDNLDPLTISRSSSIQRFIIDSRGAKPVVQAHEAWIGAKYTVGSMAYAEWDETQHPLTMLRDIAKPAIEFGSDTPHGMTGGTLANLLTVPLPKPTMTVENGPVARWSIPMPSGLVEWAKLRRTEKPDLPTFVRDHLEAGDLYPLFRKDASRDFTAPVEAMRPRDA